MMMKTGKKNNLEDNDKSFIEGRNWNEELIYQKN
jgi:hypothetical protein